VPANQLAAINHIVVLMLENRSFDHMLGFLYRDRNNVSLAGQPFEGLTGTESNKDVNGDPVVVYPINPGDKNAYFMPGADPNEGFAATNTQLYGSPTPPAGALPTNSGFVTNFANAIDWESKSPRWAVVPGTTASMIMGMFTPQALPVLSGLARGFAVCDHWFSPAPTETMPNRAFANAATSQGHMDDVTKSYTVKSIFGALSARGLSWAIYGYSQLPLTRLNFPDTNSAPAKNFGLFPDFKAAAAAGTLPAYTFIEPSWESTGNSQHPNYDVALGEQLIHDVYYALQAGPAWHQTLFVLTYDEHGGCFDHVTPPAGATPPDSSAGEFGFDFRRFGVRVPTVLISPWIPAGTVFRVPAGATPFDHTSILKTIELRWGLPALTARDGAAMDVGDALSLAAPRADDPLAAVAVPVSAGHNPSAGLASHLQRVHAELAARFPTPDPEFETVATKRGNDDFRRYIAKRQAAWIKSKAGAGR
jgi:phospholipase C